VPPNRKIIEDLHFRNELLAVEPDPKRADQLIEGAIWVLSRDPYQGVQQGGPYSLTWFFTVQIPPNRQALLFYAFDDSEVLLVSFQLR